MPKIKDRGQSLTMVFKILVLAASNRFRASYHVPRTSKLNFQVSDPKIRNHIGVGNKRLVLIFTFHLGFVFKTFQGNFDIHNKIET